MMRYLGCVFLLTVAIQGNSHAWWSLELVGYRGLDTHRKITNAVTAKHEDGSEYADIKKFSSVITEGASTQGNDEKAHGKLLAGDTTYPLADLAARFDGGPYELWYKRGLDRYKNGQFSGGTDSAYFYFALMTHLVEDQAVPAHAANIFHAKTINDARYLPLPLIGGIPTNPDDLEARASDYGMEPRIGFDLNNEKDFGKNPVSAYYDDNDIGLSEILKVN